MTCKSDIKTPICTADTPRPAKYKLAYGEKTPT
jgi:hypothetical protein